MKNCSYCKTKKSPEEFYVDKSRSTGLSSYCRPCVKETSAKRYLENPEKIKQRVRQAKMADPEKVRACSRAHWARHKTKRNAEQRENFSKKYGSDLIFKLRHVMRGMLNRSAKLAYGTKAAGSLDKIGYTPEQLHQRISVQLKDGMTWENFGKWHIDHKKPIRRFIEQGIRDFAVINALSNLQPLWAKENLVKGNRFQLLQRLP